MKVAIDAYNIARSQGTGVATYGRNLARAALGLGHDVALLFGKRGATGKNPLLNEIALADDENPSTSASKAAQFLPGRIAQAAQGVLFARQAHAVPISGEVILPHGLKIDRARYFNVSRLYTHAHAAFRVTGAFTRVVLPDTAIAHWSYPLPLKAKGAGNIYTLHDLVPLRLPYTTADQKRHYFNLCRRIVRDADHILTVSECSRQDIVRILGADEKRVTNLYQSSNIADVLQDIPDEQIAREVEGLLGVPARGYYLFFGAVEPKKNIARILEAYLASGSDHPLVIVGAPGWGSEQDAGLLKQMTTLDHGRRVRWLGYLPRQMLATVIAGARATLFPSLYEGFGLPVLESMTLGTPVITSNTSSLPEVAGDAALLVDPYDVRSISKAIAELDSDPGLVGQLSAIGRKQAAAFSHDVYMQRLGAFYRELGESSAIGATLANPVQKAAST